MPAPRLEISTSYRRGKDEEGNYAWVVDLEIRLQGELVYSVSNKSASLDIANGMVLSALAGLKVA